MGSLLIKNASAIMNGTVKTRSCVYCENGVIKGIGAGLAGMAADEQVDAGGNMLSPGFIDLHAHGAKGLLAENGRGQLEALCRILPGYGVTAFVPAVCPMRSEEEDIALLRELSQARPEGAEILGILLEGHYLALSGAISNIQKNTDEGRLRRLIGSVSPYKPIFAISPEIEGIEGLLPIMASNGFPAFITHTAASAEETRAAIDAGATHATHFYNVFPYRGDNEPGVRSCGAIETILANQKASVDFILDGEHVKPETIKMAIEAKGAGKVSLITDSNINAGMPPGRYKGIGNIEVEVFYEGGPARLTEDSAMPGKLAGSGLTMDRAVQNAIRFLGVGIAEAVAMASSNPASALGLEKKGRIEEGFDADMALLDEGLNVLRCWVGGICRYTGKE